MFSQANVHAVRRFRGCLALAGVVVAAPACFLPIPPVDADPSTSEASSSGESSSGDAPTTSGDAGSSTGGESSTGAAGSTTGSTTAEEEGSGTTEFSLPTCPYAPPGTKFALSTSKDGDLTLQECGAEKKFERLRLDGFAGTLAFAVCSDEDCGECVESDQVALDLIVPDPFMVFGDGVVEGGCYEVDVKWERPSTVEPAQCTGSTVVLRRQEGGQLAAVPSLIYRLASMLDVADEVGEFSLAANAAGTGVIQCPCDGDCCREEPGSRDVQFTVTVDGEVFMGEPLAAEQAQSIPLGDEADVAGISLVRSYFPSDCAEPAVHEWVFAHPAVF